MGTGEGGGCSALGRLVVPHWPAVVEGAFSGDAEWDFGVGRGPREFFTDFKFEFDLQNLVSKKRGQRL